MTKHTISQLQSKLKKYRKRRNKLELNPSIESFYELDKLYKKINYCENVIQKGGTNEKEEFPERSDADDEIVDAVDADIKNIKTVTQTDEYLPDPKASQELIDIYTKFQEMEQYINLDSEYKIRLKFNEFKKLPKYYFLLFDSTNWENFLNTFQSIFVENSEYFQFEIFRKINSHSLSALLIIIKYFLYKYKNNTEQKIKSLNKLNEFYPELFKKKSYGVYIFGKNLDNTFLSFLGSRKEDNFVKSYEILGIDLFNQIDMETNDKEKMTTKTLKLTKLFPEFVKNQKFCKLVKDTDKIQDIIHLLVYLDQENCNIDWKKKFLKLINMNINKDTKDQYILIFIFSINNISTCIDLITTYRRKNYNFDLLQNLLNILNFDTRFMDNIKDKDVKEKFQDKVLKLRETKELHQELWYWIKQYTIKYDENKKYYFNLLNNYFTIMNELPDKENVELKKMIEKEISSLQLDKNLKYIIKNMKNYKIDINPIILFTEFITKYSKFFDKYFSEVKFNIEVYNLIKINITNFKFFILKDEDITETNLNTLLDIKYKSMMYNKLSLIELNNDLVKIKEITDKKSAKQLKTSFYMKIRSQLNSNTIRDLLYFDDIRLDPILLLSMIKNKIEENKKEIEEPEIKEEDIIVLDDNFDKKSIREKLKIMNEIIDKNDEEILELKQETQKYDSNNVNTFDDI